MLLHAVLRNRDGRLRAMARNAWRDLRDILFRARMQARFKDLELEFVLDRPDTDPEALLLFAFETAEQVAQRDGRCMVVAIDEFQELENLGGATLLKRMYARTVMGPEVGVVGRCHHRHPPVAAAYQSSWSMTMRTSCMRCSRAISGLQFRRGSYTPAGLKSPVCQ